MVVFADAEDLVQAWLQAGPVGTLVGGKIFQAMPVGFADPKLTRPVLTLSRVGGAVTTSTTPTDIARISFRVWAPNRPLAKTITKALVSAIDDLGQSGGFTGADGKLETAELVTHLWAPEPISDIPRYIIDARFVTCPLVGV